MNSRILITIFIVIIILEGVFIAYLTVPALGGKQQTSRSNSIFSYTNTERFVANYSEFNAVIANDTEANASQSYRASWVLSVSNGLAFSNGNLTESEAQIAIAPVGPNEALSIPTLIVQERADGLLRVEYYAQNWPNTYGLILYNSTRSDLFGSNSNVTLEFISTGPPSEVNPQIAPRPNGNLSILDGGSKLVLDYPIAWASIDSLYFYGLKGSSFNSGELKVSISQIEATSG